MGASRREGKGSDDTFAAGPFTVSIFLAYRLPPDVVFYAHAAWSRNLKLLVRRRDLLQSFTPGLSPFANGGRRRSSILHVARLLGQVPSKASCCVSPKPQARMHPKVSWIGILQHKLVLPIGNAYLESGKFHRAVHVHA